MGYKKMNLDWHGREYLPLAIWWLMLLMHPNEGEA